MAAKVGAATKPKAAKAATEVDKLLAKAQDQLLEKETVWLNHGQAVGRCW